MDPNREAGIHNALLKQLEEETKDLDAEREEDVPIAELLRRGPARASTLTVSDARRGGSPSRRVIDEALLSAGVDDVARHSRIIYRRERARERAKDDERKAKLRAIEEKKEKERLFQLELERNERSRQDFRQTAGQERELEEFRKKQEEEAKVQARLDYIAEVERKTKRFFDVNMECKKLFTTNTGAVYFGDFEFLHPPPTDKRHPHLADDWHPHGWGEMKLDTGQVVYEGEWVRGKRHGKGTWFFDDGKTSWEGTFYKNEARGLGTYHWTEAEEDDEGYEINVQHHKRKAIYHRDKRAAWQDELVPGRRVRVPQFSYASPTGADGTIVGRLKDTVDLAKVFFELKGNGPLMHHFARQEDRDLRRFDPQRDATGVSHAPKLKSDHSENYYRDAVESKALPPPSYKAAGRDQFLAKKAEQPAASVEQRQAQEEIRQAALAEGVKGQKAADAASAEEEAKWQAEVQAQVARRQEARRQRTILLRGGKAPATLTKPKSDEEELKAITTKRHAERDLKDFVKIRE